MAASPPTSAPSVSHSTPAVADTRFSLARTSDALCEPGRRGQRKGKMMRTRRRDRRDQRRYCGRGIAPAAR
eukprot:5809895-Pyramimonas_sp.AAC.2